jgi:hypothetical protein
MNGEFPGVSTKNFTTHPGKIFLWMIIDVRHRSFSFVANESGQP